MNESNTRAELIEPLLEKAGWGRNFPQTKIDREHKITLGKIQSYGGRSKSLWADYVLSYKNVKLAVIEAKSSNLSVSEGVAQAKNYADKLQLDYAFALNGEQIYQVSMKTGREALVSSFPSPDELWNKVFEKQNEWLDKFHAIPFVRKDGSQIPRFYQEIAVNRVLRALAQNKKRILLTLATGTGKTFIAFQIAWKLFQTRWNLRWDGTRQARILFLVDRNILADQAFNAFSHFPEDALVRIDPGEIARTGRVPKNGSIFFTIFQTLMSGEEPGSYCKKYPTDYFDFIIIDECHRGGARDDGNWRAILDYFTPAVQLGLTATPRRKDNADTYDYFGNPVYSYSLKEGIHDGFLTPFRLKWIKSTLDSYLYEPNDIIIDGDVDTQKEYTEEDFNHNIEIQERERNRVKVLFNQIDPKEKAIVFCAHQAHALLIRDLINQQTTSKDPNYCQRVTSDDGELGNQYLRSFQDNDRTTPTILTSSQKLSTGVDARNIRSIVLLRPIKSIIEFKQIIGRGTRLFEGKNYFTIYDYVGAYSLFSDPDWDGEPESIEEVDNEEDKKIATFHSGKKKGTKNGDEKKIIKIKLADGKEREIQSTIRTHFFDVDGKPISSEDFLHNLHGHLPQYFKDEEGLRKIWSVPETRKAFIEGLGDASYTQEALATLQKMVDAERSDLFDVLGYVAFAIKPISREQRVNTIKPTLWKDLSENQKEFLDFVLSKYIEVGSGELEQDRLPNLLRLKYLSIEDAEKKFDSIDEIKKAFRNFQKILYNKPAA